MALVRLMYWKEIPVTVQASEGGETISHPLDARFQEAADAVAMFDGSAGTDEYLDAWELKDYGEVDAPLKEAAAAIAMRFNNGFPEDFVARIRDLDRAGERNPTPGAIDDWLED
ncbi:MAG: virulence factor [Chloroflexi bacterium]|nr:virulence factor [Chloroflexota bacterium]MCH7641927.1 virulence factor [Chloroflexota bacterium]